MKSCLIVIDAQQSFRHRSYFTERDLAPYLAAQNALIRDCVAAGVPIVRVLHVDGPEEATNPFARASGNVRPLEGLADFEAAAHFVKHRHSALVGTGLDVWLTRHGISRLTIFYIVVGAIYFMNTPAATNTNTTTIDRTVSRIEQVPAPAQPAPIIVQTPAPAEPATTDSDTVVAQPAPATQP